MNGGGRLVERFRGVFFLWGTPALNNAMKEFFRHRRVLFALTGIMVVLNFFLVKKSTNDVVMSSTVYQAYNATNTTIIQSSTNKPVRYDPVKLMADSETNRCMGLGLKEGMDKLLSATNRSLPSCPPRQRVQP